MCKYMGKYVCVCVCVCLCVTVVKVLVRHVDSHVMPAGSDTMWVSRIRAPTHHIDNFTTVVN